MLELSYDQSQKLWREAAAIDGGGDPLQLMLELEEATNLPIKQILQDMADQLLLDQGLFHID